MTKTMMLAGLMLGAVTLAGCGGTGTSSGSSSTAAPAGSAPSSTGSPAAPSSQNSASGGAATAAVADPCAVLNAGDIAKLTGVDVKKGTPQDVGRSKICNWLPKDGTKSDAAVFSAQEGPLPGPLTQVEGALEKQFKGSVTKLSVSGADDARYVTGKSSGLNIIDVLAQKDEVFYQVVVATPRNAGQHKSDAIKMAEALLKA